MIKTVLRSSDNFHTFNLVNMALGALVFAGAVFFLVTGEYENLLARQATEALLSRVEIGALLYSAVFWYVDSFIRPLKFGSAAQTH